MSVAVRRALYGRMAGDTTLTTLLGTPASGFSQSIYYQVAPKNAGGPYVIFNKQAGTPRYALAQRAYDNDIWLIKGVHGSPSPDVVDTIATRLDTLLTDAVLTISGKTQLYLRRESDFDFAEVVDGVIHRHAGSNFRLMYQ